MTQPGIYPRVPHDEYLADPALSRSKLRVLIEGTPMDFAAGLEIEETDAMRRGTALHMAVLEPDRFDDEYLPMPDFGDRRFKETKLAEKRWREENGDALLTRMPIPVEEYRLADDAARVVRRKRGPATALREGSSEVSMWWDQHGLPCKARCDFASPSRGLVCDIKSTTSLDDRAVIRSLTDHFAAMQAAMFNAAHYALTGSGVACYLLLVRLKRPVDMRLVHITEPWISYGEAQFMRALAIYRGCVASGEWQGWAERGVTEVLAPQWVTNTTELLNRQAVEAPAA